MQDAVAAMARTPGVLTLAGRSFVILPPTTGDMLRVQDKMRELARAKCVSPLDFALKHTHLPPAVLAVAVSEALKLGAGGGVQPTAEAVADEYLSLEGVRWRVWYHASRALPDLHPDDAAALVTPDNLLDAAEGLDRALRLGLADPNGQAPTTGSAG